MKRSDAVKHFGSQYEIARVLGISRASVCVWGEEVPEGRQAQLQIASGGKLKATRVNDYKPQKSTKKQRRRA